MTTERFNVLKKQTHDEGLHDSYVDTIIGEQAQLYIDNDIKTLEGEDITPNQRGELINAYYEGVKAGIS